MKRCPTCQRTYTAETVTFCLEDGTALQEVRPGGADISPATQPLGGGRETHPPGATMGVYARPDVAGPPVVAPTVNKRKAGFKSGVAALLLGLLSFALMLIGFIGIAAKDATNLGGGLILLTFATALGGAVLGLAGIVRAVRNENSKVMPLLGFLANVLYLLLILGLMALGAIASL